MIDATMNKDMICLLKNLKFSKFISYECAKNRNSTYGNLRVNTDVGSIEISNIVKDMPFFDIEEEISSFECKVSNPMEEFKPYCIEPFKVFEINETITDIEIINDMINVNDGEYEISFDQAIIIRTDKRIIMFSRNAWFAEDITISEHDDYNNIWSIEIAAEVWSDENENKVSIIRTNRKI